ncbi:uncharacterized protein [Bemisia tabaci]|uniref:uncharacterized protein n=1 Tax=Bemisia tabaci TaxID=7038 RepID=UPI003B27CCDC
MFLLVWQRASRGFSEADKVCNCEKQQASRKVNARGKRVKKVKSSNRSLKKPEPKEEPVDTNNNNPVSSSATSSASIENQPGPSAEHQQPPKSKEDAGCPKSLAYADADPLYIIPMLIPSPDSPPPQKRKTPAEKYAAMAEALQGFLDGKRAHPW